MLKSPLRKTIVPWANHMADGAAVNGGKESHRAAHGRFA
jgi:hypothetical protein